MVKISGYLIFYNDFTFIEDILCGLNGVIDELIFVDGPYEYCLDNLKTFGLFYDENTKPIELAKILDSKKFNFEIKYFYKCWKNEKEKIMFGYDNCVNDIVVLVDSDEFYCVDKNNLNEFINNQNVGVAAFDIFNMHRIDQYFAKASKQILFKKKYINSHEHLSYTWLVGVDDLEPQNHSLIYNKKTMGIIYHQTLNRNKIGNITKYIFYISLYNLTNKKPINEMVSNFDTNYILKNLSLTELHNIFVRSMMEMINIPNILNSTFSKLENLKIDLSKYNTNNYHGYFSENIKLLNNNDFYFYLNKNSIIDDKFDFIVEADNVKKMNIDIYEIYVEKSNHKHQTLTLSPLNNIFYINSKVSNNTLNECLIKINCETYNGDIYTIKNICKNIKNINFDLIVPFGEECYTCQSIDLKFNSNGARKEGFPFDYVGHVFLNKIMEKINNFEILSEKNIVSKRLNDESNSPYFLADKTCDFLYWHDDYYAESIFSEELINKFTF